MLEIGQATTDDLDAIYNWTLQLHNHEDDSQLDVGANFEQNLKRWVEQELNNINSLYLVARYKNRPVGFIGATTVINDSGFLDIPMKGIVQLIWVDKEHRQLNIALRLLEEIENCFKSIDIKYIECTFTVNNELAKSFWGKSGFIPFSTSARKILS